MDAQHRVEEKLDRLVEMFGVMGDRSYKISEESSASNRELTTTAEIATSSLLQAPHSPTPASCSTVCPNGGIMLAMASSTHIKEGPTPRVAFELRGGENKAHYPYITTVDLPEVTHAKCSAVGFVVKCGVDQADDAFQTMKDASKYVLVSIQSMGNLAPRSFANIKLMAQGELQPVPCPTVNSCSTRVHILRPWPPPIKVSWLALVFPEIGIAHTDMMDKVLHWADLKPWPPPLGNGSVHLLINAHASTKLREIDLAKAREDELLAVIDLWLAEMWHSGYAILINGNFGDIDLLQLLLCKKWLKLVLCKMCYRRDELKLLIGCDPKQYIADLILELEGTLYALGDYCSLCQAGWFEFMVGNHLDFLEQLELTSDELVQVASNPTRTCYMQELGTGEDHMLKFIYACNGCWPTRKLIKVPKNDCNGHWKMSRLFVNLNHFSFGLLTTETVQKGSCYLRHRFTPYMMAQYIEAIENGLIDGHSWGTNNVHDTCGCREGMSIILKDGTDRWKMKGIKKSAIKNIISAWKNVFTPAIKSLSQGDKPFCIYKPNVSNCLPCPVTISTIPGS